MIRDSNCIQSMFGCMLSPESEQSIDVDTGVTKINMVTHWCPSAGGMWAVLETKQSEFHWSLLMKILQLRMKDGPTRISEHMQIIRCFRLFLLSFCQWTHSTNSFSCVLYLYAMSTALRELICVIMLQNSVIYFVSAEVIMSKVNS
jgi:hypothetical protein